MLIMESMVRVGFQVCHSGREEGNMDETYTSYIEIRHSGKGIYDIIIIPFGR